MDDETNPTGATGETGADRRSLTLSSDRLEELFRVSDPVRHSIPARIRQRLRRSTRSPVISRRKTNIRHYHEFEICPQGEWLALDIDLSRSRTAASGNLLRVNFYRAQGPAGRRVETAWRPTMQRTFHVPGRFGILQLTQ